MSNFLTRLFRHDKADKGVDRAFVSEYTRFMDQFLEEHPEALEDQHTGRLLYWEKKVSLTEMQKMEEDKVPDDGYGFYSSVWFGKKH